MDRDSGVFRQFPLAPLLLCIVKGNLLDAKIRGTHFWRWLVAGNIHWLQANLNATENFQCHRWSLAISLQSKHLSIKNLALKIVNKCQKL